MKQIKTLQRAINVLLGANIEEDGIYGKVTHLHYNKMLDRLSRHMHPSFDGMLAVRVLQVFDNQYTDFLLYVVSRDIKEVLPCSTRAGHYWVYNPITYGGVTGTAVLAEGLYPKSLEGIATSRFGFKSFELRQVRSVKVWRDGNRDRLIDKSNPQEGLFGINIHTGGWSTLVDRWSAGCIVVPEPYWSAWCNDYFQLAKLYDLQLINYPIS